jgi:hypothetical protein
VIVLTISLEQQEKLQKLLGIVAPDSNIKFILEFILEDVNEIVKSYCNITEIPSALNSTILKMAIDMYRSRGLGSEETPLGAISSITEGDVSISYRSNVTEIKDSLLTNYKSQLSKYRKLVW